MKSQRVQAVISYSVFTVEPCHNLYQEISRLLNEYTVSYLSSDKHRTERGHSRGKLFVKTRSRVLWGDSLLPNDIESDDELPGSRIDFKKQEHQMYETEKLQGLDYVGFCRGRTTDHWRKCFPFWCRSQTGIQHPTWQHIWREQIRATVRPLPMQRKARGSRHGARRIWLPCNEGLRGSKRCL